MKGAARASREMLVFVPRSLSKVRYSTKCLLCIRFMRPHQIFENWFTQGSQHFLETCLRFIISVLFIFLSRSTNGGVAVEERCWH